MNFKTFSTKTISDMVDLLEEKDQNSELEIEFENDVCSIKSKKGFHIINTNSYLNEIWVSSCVSGPHHFGFRGGLWLNKNNQELGKILFSEFEQILESKN